MDGSRHYLYTIRASHPGAADTPNPDEQLILEDHYAYLQRHACQGTVLLAGHCVDGASRIVVIAAKSDAEAHHFMEHDPAVRRGIMRGEIHPFRISLVADHIVREGPPYDCP